MPRREVGSRARLSGWVAALVGHWLGLASAPAAADKWASPEPTSYHSLNEEVEIWSTSLRFASITDVLAAQSGARP